MQLMNMMVFDPGLPFMRRVTGEHKAVHGAPIFAVVAVALLTASCASQAPVEEVQLFGRAFDNVQVASQPLFDDLSSAERELGQRNAVNQARQAPSGDSARPDIVLAPGTASTSDSSAATDSAAPAGAITVSACQPGTPGWQNTLATDPSGGQIGYIDSFCLEHAVYYANVGDPPATRTFRDAVLILGEYSDVLLTLAEGRNIAQAQAELQSLGASVAGTLAFIPQAAPAAAAIGPVLTALGPIIEEAAKAQNLQEMRRLVGAANPHFDRLIAAIKAASPWMFETLVRSSTRRVPTETRNNPELAATLVSQIEGYRTAVSDFVVLLDEVSSAHADILSALAQADNAPLTLGSLSDRAQRLNVQANALRDAFVILRRGPQ